MKNLLRAILSNSLSIFIVSLLFSGLSIKGGTASYVYAGALLAAFSFVLDPVIKIITLPFTILTLGLLSFLTTMAALFVLTLIYPQITVNDFVIQKGSYFGIEIAGVAVTGILSFVVISATIYFLNKFILWVFSE